VIMGAAFSETEIKTIRIKLKARARECMAKYGVRKTSIKDIVSAVGISTGAFYLFYHSKERLFFDVMEDMDMEVYAVAVEILMKRMDLSPRERVILALISSCRKTDELGYALVWEAELAYILRKLPSEVFENHLINEGTRIADTLLEFGIQTSLPTGDVADIIQCLLTGLAHPMAIGVERRQRVSEFMIRAVCEKLFLDS
jgi:AcrR family transcriptional regulator